MLHLFECRCLKFSMKECLMLVLNVSYSWRVVDYIYVHTRTAHWECSCYRVNHTFQSQFWCRDTMQHWYMSLYQCCYLAYASSCTVHTGNMLFGNWSFPAADFISTAECSWGTSVWRSSMWARWNMLVQEGKLNKGRKEERGGKEKLSVV